MVINKDSLLKLANLLRPRRQTAGHASPTEKGSGHDVNYARARQHFVPCVVVLCVGFAVHFSGSTREESSPRLAGRRLTVSSIPRPDNTNTHPHIFLIIFQRPLRKPETILFILIREEDRKSLKLGKRAPPQNRPRSHFTYSLLRYAMRNGMALFPHIAVNPYHYIAEQSSLAGTIGKFSAPESLATLYLCQQVRLLDLLNSPYRKITQSSTHAYRSSKQRKNSTADDAVTWNAYAPVERLVHALLEYLGARVVIRLQSVAALRTLKIYLLCELAVLCFKTYDKVHNVCLFKAHPGRGFRIFYLYLKSRILNAKIFTTQRHHSWNVVVLESQRVHWVSRRVRSQVERGKMPRLHFDELSFETEMNRLIVGQWLMHMGDMELSYLTMIRLTKG
ncbi:hypothetical protein EAG_03533 [Camponotus floridanus]|uniref:Uncharacterized protein n=1 Tax=Camponotus floridanus TaxID=104421 RepID=E2A1V5_CAMFO|nr:hypothetical protein EAG_03533 [Camponotus floridanus]